MVPDISVRHGKISVRRKTRRPLFATLVITGGILAVSPPEILASPWLHHAADGHSAASHLDAVGILSLVSALVALAAAHCLGAPRRRDVARLFLAGLLSVAAVEAAVHSVHHLGDPLAVETCAVFASSGHVDGTCDSAPSIAGPTWAPHPAPVIDGNGLARLLWFRPDEGRAPPAALSR